jgi:hypothetical protein
MSEINTDAMDRDELEATAADLGVTFASNIGDANLRKKINQALGQTAPEMESGPAEQPFDVPNPEKEKQFEIRIAKHEQDKQPVQGGVNGKSFVIERGKSVIVAASVVEALNNAVQWHFDPETLERTDVQGYPFQIIREV